MIYSYIINMDFILEQDRLYKIFSFFGTRLVNNIIYVLIFVSVIIFYFNLKFSLIYFKYGYTLFELSQGN